jgi:glycosyltransferase involved in cell wall biosynthesis
MMDDITFLILNFDVGGAQRHTLDLAEALNQHHGLTCRIIGLSAQRPSPILTPRDLARISYLDRGKLKTLGMFTALFRELRQRPTRLLLGVNQAGMTAAWAARAFGPHRGRVGGVFHTTLLRNEAEERAQHLHNLTMRRLDRIAYVSARQADYWLGRGITTPHEVILNGIVLDQFTRVRDEHRAAMRAQLGYATDDFVIGLSARFRDEKNHAQLIRAIAALRARGLPACALMVGDGPTLDATRALADQLGGPTASACSFVGEHEDVRPYLAAMDAGVLCSTSVETLSIAALEMMATGMPLVLSDIGGASEIVEDGRNGFLFPAHNDAKFEDALARLMQRDDRGAQFAQAGRQIARARFEFTVMVDAYLRLFRSLVPAASHAGRHPT